MPDAGVRLIRLEKRFGDVSAVRSLDIDIASGEFVVLVGPSGCGKTTVLRMIAGLEEPTAGEIRIGGRVVNDVDPAERDVAMVFQNYALYPHMSVRANLAFGLKMRGVRGSDLDAKVSWAASTLGLDEVLHRKPGQLSGGQRQRVALGRAMVRDPRAFLFDEPLSNLDARLRLEMRAEIAELHRTLGATMIFVTHDQVEAMTLGQRIAVLNDGELQQFAEPMEVYRAPANLFVARFIGTPSINTVHGAVGTTDDSARFRCDGLELSVRGVTHAGTAVLAVRPEALRLVDADAPEAAFQSRVRRLEALGNEVLVHLDGPAGTSWVARVEPGSSVREETRTGVRLTGDGIHLFTEDGTRRLTGRADA